MRSLSRDRSRLVLCCRREGTHIQVLVRSRQRRPTRACLLESVIDCSPRALVGPGAVGPLVRGCNADHL